jgi:hypothetical protein
MMSGIAPSVFGTLLARWEDLRRALGFAAPLTALPPWMAPAMALGALLALAVTAGVALAALATLITALLVAYLLLERVFGISVALIPAPR